MRMIVDARHGTVGRSRAAQRVRVLEAPLDAQVGPKLRDEELLRALRIRGVAILGTDHRIVAVRPEPAVVIVLDDDGVRAVVLVDARCRVPPESEGAKELA